MIRQLRQRFIRIALLALTMAMLLVAGTINTVHLFSTVNELNTTLGYLAENENAISQEKHKRGEFDEFGENGERPESFTTGDSVQQIKQKGHNHMQNTLEESRYFIAIQRTDGEIIIGTGSKETEYTEEELLAIAGRCSHQISPRVRRDRFSTVSTRSPTAPLQRFS